VAACSWPRAAERDERPHHCGRVSVRHSRPRAPTRRKRAAPAELSQVQLGSDTTVQLCVGSGDRSSLPDALRSTGDQTYPRQRDSVLLRRPDWIQGLADLNPFAYAVNVARTLFTGRLVDPTVLRGFAVVIPLTLLALWWRHARFDRRLRKIGDPPPCVARYYFDSGLLETKRAPLC
jgi:hypothetical protein